MVSGFSAVGDGNVIGLVPIAVGSGGAAVVIVPVSSRAAQDAEPAGSAGGRGHIDGHHPRSSCWSVVRPVAATSAERTCPGQPVDF